MRLPVLCAKYEEAIATWNWGCNLFVEVKMSGTWWNRYGWAARKRGPHLSPLWLLSWTTLGNEPNSFFSRAKNTNVIFSPKFCHTGEKRHFQSYDTPLMAGDLGPLQRRNTFFTFTLTFCGKPPSYYTKSCQLAFHLQRWRTISESQKLLHRNWPREGWRLWPST